MWLLAGMGLAQPADSSQVGYIIVSAQPEAIDSQRYARGFSHARDFYRRREVRLIDFDQRQNARLNEARAEADSAAEPGLVPHLIHGLQTAAIRAIDPSRPGEPYSYRDLLLDMMTLQRLEPDSLGRVSRDQFAWDNLARIMLLVRVRGYNPQAARSYDYPAMLMLVWLDRQAGQQNVLALFDLADIQPWVERLQCRWRARDGRWTGTNAYRWLFASMSSYPAIDFSTDDLPTLPADRRSLDAWPDFYRQE